MACTLLVNLWRARWMSTASMSFCWSCWYRMSTWGMMLWKTLKKKTKSSSCSIRMNPDASLTVGWSNDVLMVSKHSMRSARFSLTVLTILLLKFHLVAEALGSLRATTWSRMLVLLGEREKKLEIPLSSEKKTFTLLMLDVACCMIRFSWCA